jgi:general secretion pathway protein J
MRRVQGFTLLELLLAMSLAAMVLSLLAGGMYVVMKDWQRNSQRLDDQLDLTLGLLQIDTSLQAAYPHYYVETEKNTPYIHFEGDDQALTWVSTASPARQAGLSAWQIKAGEDKGVELRTVPAYADNPTKRLEEQQPILLFAGYQLHLDYLAYDNLQNQNTETANQNKWLQKWSGRERLSLPKAVRLHLSGEELPPLEIVSLILVNEHVRLAPKQIK